MLLGPSVNFYWFLRIGPCILYLNLSSAPSYPAIMCASNIAKYSSRKSDMPWEKSLPWLINELTKRNFHRVHLPRFIIQYNLRRKKLMEWLNWNPFWNTNIQGFSALEGIAITNLADLSKKISCESLLQYVGWLSSVCLSDPLLPALIGDWRLRV